MKKAALQNPMLALAEDIGNKQPAVLATVIKVKGGSPVKVGVLIALLGDWKTAGTVGGGGLEAAIIRGRAPGSVGWHSRLQDYNLTEQGTDAVGTLCGGEVRVFLQPFLPPPQLIIVGGGHIGRPLKVMGEAAGLAAGGAWTILRSRKNSKSEKCL